MRTILAILLLLVTSLLLVINLPLRMIFFWISRSPMM